MHIPKRTAMSLTSLPRVQRGRRPITHASRIVPGLAALEDRLKIQAPGHWYADELNLMPVLESLTINKVELTRMCWQGCDSLSRQFWL